jgi:hypothetical protein
MVWHCFKNEAEFRKLFAKMAKVVRAACQEVVLPIAFAFLATQYILALGMPTISFSYACLS